MASSSRTDFQDTSFTLFLAFFDGSPKVSPLNLTLIEYIKSPTALNLCRSTLLQTIIKTSYSPTQHCLLTWTGDRVPASFVKPRVSFSECSDFFAKCSASGGTKATRWYQKRRRSRQRLQLQLQLRLIRHLPREPEMALTLTLPLPLSLSAGIKCLQKRCVLPLVDTQIIALLPLKNATLSSGPLFNRLANRPKLHAPTTCPPKVAASMGALAQPLRVGLKTTVVPLQCKIERTNLKTLHRVTRLTLKSTIQPLYHQHKPIFAINVLLFSMNLNLLQSLIAI